ncbi:HepT-like ribonuclease domain-containing protein [Rhodothermus marinus]
MVGLRNLLVHEYATIDVERLYRHLDQLPDFVQFIESIQPYL